MFSDPERRHETEITIIQGLKQVFIFCSVYIVPNAHVLSSEVSRYLCTVVLNSVTILMCAHRQ